MKLHNLIAALFSILFIFSCSDDPDASDVSNCGGDTFAFLADGNTMIYDYSSFSCLLNDRLKTTISTRDDQSFFATNECFSADTPATTTEISNTVTLECNGNLYSHGEDEQFDSGSINYKGSRSLGDTWTQKGNGALITNYEVLEKNVTIEVPAGSYICDKISVGQQDAFNVDTVYFNNAVGFVKYDGFLLQYELLEINF